MVLWFSVLRNTPGYQVGTEFLHFCTASSSWYTLAIHLTYFIGKISFFCYIISSKIIFIILLFSLKLTFYSKAKKGGNNHFFNWLYLLRLCYQHKAHQENTEKAFRHIYYLANHNVTIVDCSMFSIQLINFWLFRFLLFFSAQFFFFSSSSRFFLLFSSNYILS